MIAKSNFEVGQKEYKKDAKEKNKMHFVGRNLLFLVLCFVRLFAVLCCWVGAPVVAADAVVCPLSNSSCDQTAINLWTSCTSTLVSIKPGLNGSLADLRVDGRGRWSCQNAGCDVDCNQWFPLANPCVDGRNGWSCQDAGCDVVCCQQLPLVVATLCVDGRNGWSCQDAGCDVVCCQQLPLVVATLCVDGRNGWSCQDAGCDVVCCQQLPLVVATLCVDGRNGWSCQDAGCDLVCSRQLPLATPCGDGRMVWSGQQAGRDVVSAWMMAVSSADKICPLFLNIVWNGYGLNGSVWSESFVYRLDSFSTFEGSKSSFCGFCLLLGICLIFTCWLGMCCKPSARPGKKNANV